MVKSLFWCLEYLATWMELAIGSMFCGILLNGTLHEGKKNKKKIIVYTTIFSFIVILGNRIRLFSYMSGVLGVLILGIMQCLIYRKKYGTIIFDTFIYVMIVSGVDFITAQVGGIVFYEQTTHILQHQSIERCICMIASKCVLCLIMFLFSKYYELKMELPVKYICLLCPTVAVLVGLNYYVVERTSITGSQEIKILSAVFFVITILLNILIFILVLKMAENYRQKQNILLLELQNEMMMKAEKNTRHAFQMWRSSIHDYKHKIFAIQCWLKEGKIEEVQRFVQGECEILSEKVFYTKIGNDIVDTIVNTKQKLAEEKNIAFSIQATMPSQCMMSDMDLVCILGNLIDNAIEACEGQERKQIEVIIREVKNLLIIKIINSYEGILPDELTTTKKQKALHGIGTKNVKNIVKKYDGTYEMTQQSGEVMVTVVVSNKKE